MSSQSALLTLAEDIRNRTFTIVQHLQDAKQAEPNFEPDSPVVEARVQSEEIQHLRNSINDAANDLLLLLNGPRSFLRTFLTTHYELAAYQTAVEYKFFENVPLKGGVHVTELANVVGMDADRVGRFLRLLATQRVFKEIEKNVFGHTAASATLAIDGELNSAVGMQMDEMFKAASATADAIRDNPSGTHSSNSPFKCRHGLELFEFYAKYPQKGARFAEAMAGTSQLDRQFTELRDGFPWQRFDNGKVVDVGGGSGHVSIYLAKQFPKLSFVVQDKSPHMLAQGVPLMEAEPSVGGRVAFQQHDFFEPQPIDNASAFFIRQCVHNWPDKECTEIFRAFVPALQACEPETRLLINDTVLPKLGQKTRYEERGLRQLDVAMLVVNNAKQRTEEEFRGLLKEADERFEVVKVHSDGSMGLIEVRLRKEEK